MHRSTEGHDNIGNFLGNAGILRDFHVHRDRCDRGAGAERGSRRAEEVPEHDLCRALAAAEAGVQRRRNEQIDHGNDIVNADGAGVVGNEVRAVRRNERGEEAEEADGRIVGDELDDLQKNVRKVVEQQRHAGLAAAAHLNAEAEDDRRNDQRKDSAAAPELGEVGLREEVDDERADIYGTDAGLFIAGRGSKHGNKMNNDVHQNRSNGSGGKERSDRDAHDAPRAFCRAHVCDRRGDGAEHHRHNDAEHHINKQRPERFESRSPRPCRTDNTAGDDAEKHQCNETVFLHKLLHCT